MRIRTIKPEIYADEKVSRWCFQDRLLFIGLISLADDYGIIRNQPKLIAGTIFPEDEDIGSRDIHEALMRLSEDGPVVLYKVSGVSYIALRNWSKHQKVQHPGKAKLPHPTEEVWLSRNQFKPESKSLAWMPSSRWLTGQSAAETNEHSFCAARGWSLRPSSGPGTLRSI